MIAHAHFMVVSLVEVAVVTVRLVGVTSSSLVSLDSLHKKTLWALK